MKLNDGTIVLPDLPAQTSTNTNRVTFVENTGTVGSSNKCCRGLEGASFSFDGDSGATRTARMTSLREKYANM